jgi:hypothetical protein
MRPRVQGESVSLKRSSESPRNIRRLSSFSCQEDMAPVWICSRNDGGLRLRDAGDHANRPPRRLHWIVAQVMLTSPFFE